MRRLPLLPAALIASFASVSSFAFADRNIDAPVATKLTAGSVRLEEAFGLNGGSFRRDYLMVALDGTFEIEARRFQTRRRDDTAIDLYATVVSPFQGYAPGIAAGVRDVADVTPDGRRGWIAITSREPYEIGDRTYPADITLGAFVGRRGSALVAVSIPLGAELRLLAENDGIRTSAGFQIRRVRGLDLRLFTQDNGVYGSIRYARKF